MSEQRQVATLLWRRKNMHRTALLPTAVAAISFAGDVSVELPTAAFFSLFPSSCSLRLLLCTSSSCEGVAKTFVPASYASLGVVAHHYGSVD